MRRLALAPLLFLVAALFEPVVSLALSDPMPCCSGPQATMCCPLNGSCVMKACQGREFDGRSVSLSPFALPSPVSMAVRAQACRFFAPQDARQKLGPSAILDPPPRA